MSRARAKKIVKKYAEALKREHYSFFALYLFGSTLENKDNPWSDIDVAVISDKLKRNIDRNRLLLWKIRRKVDTRIEPHGFTVDDFIQNANPMIYEIKKKGIKVV